MIEKIKKYIWLFSIVKYLSMILLTCLTYLTTKNLGLVIVGLLELGIIFIISNALLYTNKIFAYIFNVLLLFLYSVEQVVLIFGNSYLSLIMLSNLDSISALSGKFGLYFSLIIPLIVILLLPIKEVNLSWKRSLGIIILEFLWILSLFGLKEVTTSPFFNYYDLVNQKIEQEKVSWKISHSKNVTAEFYKSEVANYTSKPTNLSDKPNIILILTEGLSEEFVDDKRNITPNIRMLREKSINFTNYYNHTFATYRGIRGQLYSGYQFENYDKNTLVSIEDILKDSGYDTTFINTEPANLTFSNYLKQMNFDEVTYQTKDRKGVNDTMSDKEAYQFLMKYSEEKDSDVPFFITMYTFGTHTSLDSTDKKFGNGKNSQLNRVYNMDYQFGKFVEQFNRSPISDNTILIFTTDHATHVNSDYIKTYPNHTRGNEAVGQVPLFIYYKNGTSQTINANGRNSLDLAPTILDYVDISAPNYFLGTSLFSNKESSLYSHIFSSETKIMTTKGGKLSNLSKSELKKVKKKIQKYNIAQIQPQKVKKRIEKYDVAQIQP